MGVTPTELSLLLRCLMHRHRERHQEIVNSLGLYYGQPMLLMILLDHGEISQREIADIINSSPSSVTVSIRRLEKAELLTKTANEDDLRYTKVCLTDKGRETAEKCRSLFESVDDRMFSEFSQEDLQQLKSFFIRMTDNLNTTDEGNE